MKTQSTIIMAVILLFLSDPGTSLSRAELAPTNSVPARTRMLNGTIDGIDSLERLVTLQSEKHDTWVFIAVGNGELLKGLNKGDRVVIELDEQGVAQKISKPAINLKNTSDAKS